MHDPKDLKDAVQRLSRGATVGMVDAELARKGVPSGPRDEVLEFAKRIVNRRFRLKHIAIALLGGLILIAGLGLIYYNIQNGRTSIYSRDRGVGVRWILSGDLWPVFFGS